MSPPPLSAKPTYKKLIRRRRIKNPILLLRRKKFFLKTKFLFFFAEGVGVISPFRRHGEMTGPPAKKILKKFSYN